MGGSTQLVRGSARTLMDRILLSPPDVGEPEREALLRAFDSGWIAPAGPELAAFEQELAAFSESESCVVLSSGTAALHLGMIALGVQPGDEVVVQTGTFAATAFAVRHAGAVPVFCDVELDSWCLDADLLSEFLEARSLAGRLPAAVISVDLYGLCPDYAKLRAVCDRFGVPLLEDAAEALGSATPQGLAGTLGDLGVFSFNGNKIMTTSGGGALVGPKDKTDYVRFLSTQAREPFLHYEHLEVGFNYRMSNLLAALGRAQLAGLPPKIERRRVINASYRAALPSLVWPDPASTSISNCWLSVALLPEGASPTATCAHLDECGIEARPSWKPMHLQPVFKGAESIGGSAAEAIFDRGLCLPSGSSMTDGQVEQVIAAVQNYLDQLS